MYHASGGVKEVFKPGENWLGPAPLLALEWEAPAN